MKRRSGLRKNKKVAGVLCLIAFIALIAISVSKQKATAQAKPEAAAKKYADGVYILKFDDKLVQKRYRAKALDSPVYVKPGQRFTFKAKGCTLAFKSPASDKEGLFASPPQSGKKEIVVTIGKQPGTYQYFATCDGIDVEGNSPPVIIVDPIDNPAPSESQ